MLENFPSWYCVIFAVKNKGVRDTLLSNQMFYSIKNYQNVKFL